MSLPAFLPLRLALRELRGGLAGFRILLACLALGVAAIAGVGSVRAAIEAGLRAEGAVLLGGDAEAEFTYRFADEEERAWLAEVGTQVSEIADFRSMAVAGTGAEEVRALTQVKAVDDAYPLTGTVVLAPEIPLAEALADRDGLPGAVVAQALADRLGITPGDTFRLGEKELRLAALLVTEPDAATAGFGLGPRTLLRREALDGSGLLAPGTLFNARYRITLPEGANLDALAAEAAERFRDKGLRWRDARAGAPGVAQFIDRLGAFLILVGLAGLAVGGIGVSAAVRTYLARKTSVIATLRTLGASRSVIFRTYFWQIAILSAVGIALGLVIGGGIPVLLSGPLTSLLPIPARFGVYPGPLAEAALYGALAAGLFTLWPLARAEEVRPAALYREGAGSAGWPRPRFLLWTALLLALLVAAAAWFSGSPRLAFWMAGGILAALALLAVMAGAVRLLARAALPLARGRPALRWALSGIAAERDGAQSTILSLGLGLAVLAAVGQIDGNLQASITRGLPEVAPSYFFVDIQRDQMDDFRARLEADPGVSRIDAAPMLRGVITQINGKPAEEAAGDHWVLEGDRGVTYSEALPERTRLTAGQWWTADYTGPPLISFAAEEAEEMGLQLGDRLVVNILGRDIEAEIASFREVDFSTAGIGFVMTMNPAALAGAPHSFIATVYAEEAAEAAILRDLGRAMPNITAIRVRDAIGQVSELLQGIAGAIRWGAAAALVTGFVVLIGTAAAGAAARIYEAAVLRTLGAGRGRLFASFAIRAGLLGAAAGLVALLAGALGAWAVMVYVMEAEFTLIWSNALLVVAGGILATLLAGMAFAWAPLSARPAQVLRARE